MIDAVTPNIRRAIIAVYKGRCQYCRADGANHIEHIVARVNGGTSDLDNLTLGCGSCNMAKGTLTLSPGFIEIMQARARHRSAAVEHLVAAWSMREDQIIAGRRRIALPKAKGQATPQNAAAYKHTDWGSLFFRYGDLNATGCIRTFQVGHTRGGYGFNAVFRPRGASRDLTIGFVVDISTGIVAKTEVTAYGRADRGYVRAVEPTQRELMVGSRYLLRHRKIILSDVMSEVGRVNNWGTAHPRGNARCPNRLSSRQGRGNATRTAA